MPLFFFFKNLKKNKKMEKRMSEIDVYLLRCDIAPEQTMVEFIYSDCLIDYIKGEMESIASSKNITVVMWHGPFYVSFLDRTDSPLKTFSQWLQHNTTLRFLSLNEQRIQLYDPETLFRSLSKHKTLQQLVLNSMFIYDTHCGHLSDMLKANTVIEYLCLSRNLISDDGFEVILQGLAKNKTIRGVDFSCNDLKDVSGIKVYEILMSSPYHNLLAFDLTCNHISSRIQTDINDICFLNSCIRHDLKVNINSRITADFSHGKWIRTGCLDIAKLQARFDETKDTELELIFIYRTQLPDSFILDNFGRDGIKECVSSIVLLRCSVSELAQNYMMLNFPKLKHLNVTN